MGARHNSEDLSKSAENRQKTGVLNASDDSAHSGVTPPGYGPVGSSRRPPIRANIDVVLRIALGALLAAFVYVIYDGIHEHVTEVGDNAPDFSITADNGRTISLPNFGGKVLVLNFWASWCPPCVDETPSLSQLASQFTNRGVVVLGVSIDKDEKAYRDFLKQYNPAFLTARDPEIKISADYGTFKIPETYIIDSHGKVVQKIISNTDWTDPRMTSFISSLL